MQKENLLILKTEWRKRFLSKRKEIPSERRREASLRISNELQNRGRILSFSSFGTEIDLWPLNRILASAQRLFLPRVEGDRLAAYQIDDPKQLSLSSLGILEPNPNLCRKISLTEIDIILVPGLGFDPEKHRMGYGKGHYDRLLASADIYSAGIGFFEQISSEIFPRDPWDVPVQELLLF